MEKGKIDEPIRDLSGDWRRPISFEQIIGAAVVMFTMLGYMAGRGYFN